MRQGKQTPATVSRPPYPHTETESKQTETESKQPALLRPRIPIPGNVLTFQHIPGDGKEGDFSPFPLVFPVAHQGNLPVPACPAIPALVPLIGRRARPAGRADHAPDGPRGEGFGRLPVDHSAGHADREIRGRGPPVPLSLPKDPPLLRREPEPDARKGRRDAPDGFQHREPLQVPAIEPAEDVAPGLRDARDHSSLPRRRVGVVEGQTPLKGPLHVPEDVAPFQSVAAGAGGPLDLPEQRAHPARLRGDAPPEGRHLGRLAEPPGDGVKRLPASGRGERGHERISVGSARDHPRDKGEYSRGSRGCKPEFGEILTLP